MEVLAELLGISPKLISAIGITLISGLSIAVVFGISALLPFTIPLWIKGIISAILIGVAIFMLSDFIFGKGEGEGQDLSGIEETTEKEADEIPEISPEILEISELSLIFNLDETNNVMSFSLGENVLDNFNLENSIRENLEVYPNLDKVILKNSNEIPYNYIVNIEKIFDTYDNIILVLE